MFHFKDHGTVLPSKTITLQEKSISWNPSRQILWIGAINPGFCFRIFGKEIEIPCCKEYNAGYDIDEIKELIEYLQSIVKSVES